MKKILILLAILALSSCSFSSSDSDDKDKSKTKSSQDDKKSKSKRSKSKKKKDGKDDEEEEVIINIEAATIRAGDAVSVFRTTTILEADLESAVTSKASGIVLKINVEVGDKVKAGDVLAILESDIQRLKYESANANYQKSLHNYERAKVLLKKGLANKESVDNLKFDTQSLKTNLSQAKLDLNFTKIKAPISGVITKRNIKQGNLIQNNTGVYEIVNFESLQAIIYVPENKWSLFKNNLPVKFQFDSLTQEVYGKILRIDPVIDSTTGTFRVVIDINKDSSSQLNLRPGLFGKTQIILNTHVNTKLVSKNAVIREDKNAFVYEINDDNTITKRSLELGYEMDDSLEVLSGIESGVRVVTTGKNNLSEESKVNVIEY